MNASRSPYIVPAGYILCVFAAAVFISLHPTDKFSAIFLIALSAPWSFLILPIAAMNLTLFNTPALVLTLAGTGCLLNFRLLCRLMQCTLPK